MPDDIDQKRFRFLGVSYTMTRARCHPECGSCGHTQSVTVESPEQNFTVRGDLARLVWHALEAALPRPGGLAGIFSLRDDLPGTR